LPWLNRTHHDRIGTNHSSIPNTIWPQYFTPGTQHDIVADFTPQLTVETHIWVESPQSYALENHYVAADPPCPDHTADRMSEEDPWPNLALGCDFQPKENNVQVG